MLAKEKFHKINWIPIIMFFIHVTAFIASAGLNLKTAYLNSGELHKDSDFVSWSSEDRGSQISGIVTEQEGGPVEGIWVYAVHYSTGEWGGSAMTQSDGSYTITGLLPGTYKIYTDDSHFLNYLGACYHETDDPDSPTPVEVNADQPVQGKNLSLVPGGQIRGVVTDSEGEPVIGTKVDIYDFSTGESVGTSLTQSDGSYTIKMLQTGTYRAFVSVGVSGFFEEYYNNKYYYELADAVNVSVGQTTSGIDFALEPGEVAIEAGENITVVFSRPMNPATVNRNTFFVTSDMGYNARTIEGRITYADMTATFIPDTPLDEYTFYMVTVSTDIEDMNDNSLQHDYTYIRARESISGRVSDARNKAPVEGARVYAYNYHTGYREEYAYTFSDGSYILENLSPGKYKVFVSHPDYISEYYDDIPDKEQAAPVEVIAGSETSGTDFQLVPNGKIRGTVTGPNSEPVWGIKVYAQNSFSGNLDASADTDSTGAYTIKGLAPGTYEIYIKKSVSDNYLGMFYKNAAYPEQPVTFEVAADQTIPGVNLKLEYGGQITGRVTDSRGMTVKGEITCTGGDIKFTPAEVLDYDTQYIVTIGADAKDSDGNSIQNDYTWSFSTPMEHDDIPLEVISVYPINYADTVAVDTVITAQFSRDISTALSTDTFFVTRGMGYGLETVTGTIYYSYDDRTAHFIPSAPLDYETAYTVVITDIESTDGYQLRESYRWEFTTAKQGEIQVHPELISIFPGYGVTGIMPDNVTATFSKTMNCASVKDAFSIRPDMSDLWVKVYNYNSEIEGLTPTESDGTYTIKALESGNYSVFVDGSPSKNYLGRYYDNTYDHNSATFLEVTAGQTTEGADFSLEKGGKIFGKITDADGEPVTDLSVSAYDYSTGARAGYSYFWARDSYVIKLLHTGNYKVKANVSGMNYLEEYYNNAYDHDSAVPVEVTAGQSVSGKDFVLEKGEVEIIADTTLDGVVTAKFSRPLDPATINGDTFFLKVGYGYGINTVPGKVTYNGTTATFAPAADLEPDAKYILVVTSDVKDLSGNPLQHDYELSFYTSDLNKGDINGDHIINLSDAILSLNILAGLRPLSNVYAEADVNRNGRIGQAEAIYILKELSYNTLLVTFPDEILRSR